MLQSKKCILSNKDEHYFSNVNECPLDPGGYFIIRGSEKIILIQEQLTLNKISIEQDYSGNLSATIYTKFKSRRSKNSVVLKNKNFYFRHNVFIEDIPLIIIFKSLGIEREQDIIEVIGTEFAEVLEHSIYENRMLGIVSKQQAILYLSNRLNLRFYDSIEKKILYKPLTDSYENKRKINNLVFKFILNQITSHSKKYSINIEKGNLISMMTRRLLLFLNKPNFSNDKDYYGNKRLELSGQLYSLLFEDLFKKANTELTKYNEFYNQKTRKIFFFDYSSSFRQDLISNGLEIALLTGNWSIKKYIFEKNGITQTISRLSYISGFSGTTKITTGFKKIRKSTGPRFLNSSQWGAICPIDTPEGESCGLVKNLSILSHISNKENQSYILDLCYDMGLGLNGFFFSNSTKKKENISNVFLNGIYIGIHANTSAFLYSLRKMRRLGYIGEFVSFYWETSINIVNIYTDSGRVCRPLNIIKNGNILIEKIRPNLIKKGLIFFKDLLRTGFIEFLDVNEQNNALIAVEKTDVTLKTTHLELSSDIILGICGSLVPFSEHNQSPRNTYQCAMNKQAISSISFNQENREDTVLSLLIYPQKPLVKTKAMNVIGNNWLSGGVNSCICIMSYSGYDIEDAIILNRSSVDYGFFRNYSSKRYKLISKEGIYTDDISSIINFENYNIPNIYKNSKNHMANAENNSFEMVFKKNTNNTIKKIFSTANNQDMFFIKIIIRQCRKPEIGDKFSSRHGQKGICGLLCSNRDLPFSNYGIIPDLIMNPHGFPSRMTIGKILELVASKTSSVLGKFSNGDSFQLKNANHISKRLKSLGFQKTGDEIFFSGISGFPLNCGITSGPVFYQKLKHVVQDKIHARSQGKKSNLTKQPIEGRSKGGGLRFGEMERDCIVSFGATEVALERLMLSSDLFNVFLDPKTGFITNERTQKKLIPMKIPYACKLLFQEMQSMNIVPRFLIRTDDLFENIY